MNDTLEAIYSLPDVTFGDDISLEDLQSAMITDFCERYQEITGKSVRSGLEKQNLWLQWVLMLGCFAAIIVFGMYGPGVASGEFVYMQF